MLNRIKKAMSTYNLKNIMYAYFIGLLLVIGLIILKVSFFAIINYWYVLVGIVYLAYASYQWEKQYKQHLLQCEKLETMNKAHFLWSEFVSKLLQAQQDRINIPKFAIDNYIVDESCIYNKHIFDFVLRRADQFEMLDKNMKDKIFTAMKIDLETLIKKYCVLYPDSIFKYSDVNMVNLISVEETGSMLRVRILIVDDSESFEMYNRIRLAEKNEKVISTLQFDLEDLEF